MPTGQLTAIYHAPRAGAPMQAAPSVEAVAGRGLVGDRYFDAAGSFSRWPGPHREVTLVAEEDLADYARSTGRTLAASDSRRNLLVRGVPLLDLLKRRFRVGEVELEGLRKCQPCKYLVRLTGDPALLPGLVDRGGIRARVLAGGTLHVGDAVRAA